MKELDIVIIVAMQGEKMLLIRRRDKNPMWDRKWEFPGGKIEPGEDLATAARRELLEETGLHAMGISFVGTLEHDWHLSDGEILRIHAQCFCCPETRGEVHLEVGKADQYTWADASTIQTLDTLENVGRILDMLR